MPFMPRVRRHLLAAGSLAVLALGAGCPDDGPSPLPPLPDARPQPDAKVADAHPADAPGADAANPDAAKPPADAAPVPDAGPGCATWTVDVDTFRPTGATLAAVVENGQLRLSSAGDTAGSTSTTYQPFADIKVFQQQLQGDFDVIVEVDAVQGASAFAGLHLFAGTGGNVYVETSIVGGTGSPANLSVAERGATNIQEAIVAPSTKATLRIRRSANLVTLSGTSGNASIERKNIVLGGDLMVGLALTEGSSAAVTAKVESFTVTNQGPFVRSDSFDCSGKIF
jgi:hypothetical protein